MKNNLKKLIVALAAGATLAPALPAAQINLVTVGGNASIKLIQDRLKNAGFLTSPVVTVNATNNLLFKATGSFGGKTVDWEFNLTGGAGGILDIANSTPVTLEDGVSTGVPQLGITIVAPETVGIDSSPFQEDFTLVGPVVFIKGSALGGITNITQRQAAYLEASGGSLPASFFGGTNSDPVYYVGRNNLSAVRQLIDANAYFAGTAANYTTNGSGHAIPYLLGGNPWGAGSGTEVVGIVNALTNSIGTVAAQDISGLPTLSYEGVAFSTANVINGSYPIWGYERYIYNPNAITADQQNLITALETAITDSTYEHSNSLFVGKFVSLVDIGAVVGRATTVDGGPITSTVY